MRTLPVGAGAFGSTATAEVGTVTIGMVVGGSVFFVVPEPSEARPALAPAMPTAPGPNPAATTTDNPIRSMDRRITEASRPERSAPRTSTKWSACSNLSPHRRQGAKGESGMTTSARRGFELSLAGRVLLAVLAAAAGVIHLAMVPSHWGSSTVEGVGFALVGWAQVVLAVLVLALP